MFMTQTQINPKPQAKWWSWRENLRLIAIALVLAVLLRTFIAEPRYIPSDSMLPTLATGDRLVVEKVSYHLHPPHRGDIVVFTPPPELHRAGSAFIKRVIALPGQVVAIENGRVYLDGQPLREDYLAEAIDYTIPPVQVPPGQVFVLGDNRNHSNDSHVWGFLPQENIIGRAVWRFFPLDHFGPIVRSQTVHPGP
jgi:signal peptidase I